MSDSTSGLEGLKGDAKRFYKLIPSDGSFIGNTRLRNLAGLSTDDYWKLRKKLLKGGLIQTGKGRGGSVARTSPSKAEDDAAVGLVKKEKDLYPPLKGWLVDNWGKEPKDSGDFFAAKITARPKGYRRKSGQWSRPDVTVVQVNRYEHLPSSILDVTSFEVKTQKDSGNLASVYEAAAHRRMAHNAYLVVELRSKDERVSESIVAELTRFRLGLLTMWRENGGDWNVEDVLDPRRGEPDPKELDKLLGTFFKNDQKRKLFKATIGK